MNQKIIGFFVALLLICTLATEPASASVTFADVSTKDSTYQEIQYLISLGAIKGYKENGKTYYKPNVSVTRGQAAKMAVIASGNKPLTVSTSSFSDVKVNTEVSTYIERAVKLGFFTKTSGRFGPNDTLSREEMSFILSKAFNLDTSKYSNAAMVFPDVTTSNTYASYIKAIYYNGITKGDNGKFKPKNDVTRAQFASFIARAKSEKYRLPIPKIEEVKGDSTEKIGEAYVKTNSLNVRKTPNTSSSSNIVGQVNTGDTLPVYSVEGNWVKVLFKGAYAYVSKTYVTISDGNDSIGSTNPPAESGATSNVLGKVTTNTLIRSAASGSSKSLGSLKKGATISVESISGYWAKMSYNGTSGYVHKSYIKLMNKSGSAVKNRIIILDPGHGGKDPGASRESVTEKAIVLKVSKLVKQKLEASGAKVLMTRTGDTYPTLEERVAYTKKNYGEVFVSIHVNAATSTSAAGTETFYNISTGDQYEEDKKLATYINSEIVKNAAMKNRGVKEGNFYVIRNMTIPSVLVELGFISNTADRNKLVSDKYVGIFAQSIYNGIVDYYSN